MTRKLCSLLISSFAVLLLMGAGVEEDSAALVDESGSEAVQTAATQVETEEQAEPVAAISGESVLSQVEEVDPTLTVDGQPVTADVAKTYRGDTTYVALVPMSKCLDSTVQSKWDAGTRTATVHVDKWKGVRRMELTIKGEAKEIAALVLELQERRGEELPNYIPASSSRDGVRERG